MTHVATSPNDLLSAQIRAIEKCLAQRPLDASPRMQIALVVAHEVLRRRVVAATSKPPVEQSRFDPARWPEGRAERREIYDELVDRVRARIGEVIPSGSCVAVVSRGDERLLDVTGIRGSHFPQGRDGRYAGYYPPDGEAAVAHVQELIDAGAQYLTVPATAFWWLDHYSELGQYLAPRAIHTDEDCAVFDLRPTKTPRGAAT